MAGSFFQGLGKLLDAGASYLQHQQFLERLRGMQFEEAKAQLTSYVRGMPDAGFNGLKVALTLLAKGSTDPNAVKLLNALLQSLDAVRTGRPAGDGPAPSPTPSAASPRSFDEDLTLVAGWYELDPAARTSALADHVGRLTPETFQSFQAHVERMVNNVAAEIRDHEANEDTAWGGFAEDRMSYMLARLKTGQRDPRFLARLRELQGYGEFYAWVRDSCGAIRDEAERRRRAAAQQQGAAPPTPTSGTRPAPLAPAATASLPANPDAPHPEPSVAENGSRAAIAALRIQLQEGLASGQIRADRRVSYERLLDRMERLMAPLNDPATPIAERAALLQQFRELMAGFQQAYASPGAADRLAALPSSARARTLEACIGEMKGFLFRELSQSPPQHTAERAAELMSDLTRAHQEVASLVEDSAAVAFEREMLRGVAAGIHAFAAREHLMLVRPLWQCTPQVASPSGLFYSGSDDLRQVVTTLAERASLDVPAVRGQYYGQARWDALRACHVGVFDLRGYQPGLVATDTGAATAQAGTAYELGLACAMGRPAVIVTRRGDPLPFDVDLAPCELVGDAAIDASALMEALDRAWYGRQRSSNASCLRETCAFLDQATRDHPRRRMLEATGLLDEQRIDDPIGFLGSVTQVLREQGLDDLQVIHPAWPGRYPDTAAPAVFHVMPFSESWSDAARDAARASCEARGHAYRRGDEASEGRMVESIWEDICAAQVVLVDLTGLNFNVLMELGMAHALGRTVLTVRRAGVKEPLPRNIEKLRVLDYDGPADLSRLLEGRLRT